MTITIFFIHRPFSRHRLIIIVFQEILVADPGGSVCVCGVGGGGDMRQLSSLVPPLTVCRSIEYIRYIYGRVLYMGPPGADTGFRKRRIRVTVNY